MIAGARHEQYQSIRLAWFGTIAHRQTRKPIIDTSLQNNVNGVQSTTCHDTYSG